MIRNQITNSKRNQIVKELKKLEQKHGKDLFRSAVNKHMLTVRTEERLLRQKATIEKELAKIRK